MLSADQRTLVTTLLDSLCDSRVPIMVRDQLVLQYRIEGHVVTLFEKRAGYLGSGEWTEVVVARFRWNSSSQSWSLDRPDRYSKWQRYHDEPESESFADLVEEVQRDPSCCFWG